MDDYEDFLAFKKVICIERKAFDTIMDPWEFKFYMDQGKAWGLSEIGLDYLFDYLKEVELRDRRRYGKKTKSTCSNGEKWLRKD